MTRFAVPMGLALSLLGGMAAASFAEAPRVEQGRAAIGRGAPDSAIAILEQAVAQTPKDAEAHYQLALAHGDKAMASGALGKLRHVFRARHELEVAIELDPRHIEARMMMLQADLAAPGLMGGSVAKAFEQAKAIRSIDPIRGHRAYALIDIHQKRFDLAKRELLGGIKEHPDSARAHSFLGQYLANNDKDYAGAFTEFETALRIDPSYMPSFYHLGRAAALADSNLGRGEQALKTYLDGTPKPNEPTLAWAHYQLGKVYEAAGRSDEAQQSFRDALALDPGLREARQAIKRQNRK